MLRTSSYTIYVDLPGNAEEMLLVHGYTGAYDKVSRRVATYVRSLERHRAPKPLYGEWTPEPAGADGEATTPSDEAVTILRRRGYLTELSPAEEEVAFEGIAKRLHERNLQQAPQYIVMPTYNCNLRCSYCFQDHMRTDSRFSHLLRTMSRETVDRIVAAMPQIEALHGIEGDAPRPRVVGFFGGEPFLEASRPMIEYLLGQVRAIGPATFWGVTNATDLHAYRDLLNPEMISALQITIDGPAAEHDRRRIYADGSGSYERIARNIDMALAQGVKISIRLNLDRNNVHQLSELAEDFLARGWDHCPGFSVYTAPIRAENENTDSKTTFDTWELDQTVAAMAAADPRLDIIGRPDTAIRGMTRRIFHEPEMVMPSFRESFCSAHTRMYIFDAFSDIYACWERTGDEKVRMGHIEEDGNVVLNTMVTHLWRSRTVASNPVCRKCRYAFHCGGGCAVLAFGRTAEYHSNFCDGFASRFRANVAEAYLDHTRGAALQTETGRLCDQ
jgi:uncharacterized protein